MAQWPDRSEQNQTVNPPGSKDGRHAAGAQPPQDSFGFLDRTGAAKSDPQGTPYTKIDLRAGGPAKFTTGMQRNRKPRR
jgi:hypothetical protein